MAASSDQPVLELEGVEKRFGDFLAVRGVDLAFAPGEYFCILGASGCGKSTLLRLVAGFEEPDAGRLRLAGADLRGVPPEARDVNMVFQSYALFPHMTVLENVAFGPRMKGTPAPEATARARRLLEVVALQPEANRYPEQLSGGQRQRVALARALVNEPRVLLLDEPLAALDRSLRMALRGELRRLQRELGTTFVHVTHDQEEALALSDRIGVMQAGRLLQVGPPAGVYARPDSLAVGTFLGAANVLPVEVLALEGPGPRLRLSPGLELSGSPGPGHTLAPGPAQLLVRPESLRLSLGPGGPGAGLPARVRGTRLLGADVEVDLQVGEHGLTARATREPGLLALAPDDAVLLSVDPAEALVYPCGSTS